MSDVPIDEDGPRLEELPRWMANVRRAIGIVVLVLFFYAPWFSLEDGRKLAGRPGVPYSGLEPPRRLWRTQHGSPPHPRARRS